MIDPLRAAAFELARSVREGTTTARALVDQLIARALIVNPRINAIAEERFGAARQEAYHCDARARRGEPLGPLAGVPFTVKEMIDCAGMPSTYGCSTRSERRAGSDATIVRRLRAAGAIPIASTNIPEWGLWYETANLIYGRTSNPYDVRCTCGGSTGGEAALVASGASAFGVGSDIGGSIRIPSAFCGVFGHKPSAGLIPLTGHYPVFEDVASAPPGQPQVRVNPWLTIGIIARSARDLLPLLRIVGGPDGVDPNASAITLGDDQINWEGRRVWVMDHPRIRLAGAPTSIVKGGIRRAGDTFTKRGADVRALHSDMFRNAVVLWFKALESVGDAKLAVLMSPDGKLSVMRELMRYALGSPRYTFPALVFCLLEQLPGRSQDRVARALEQIAALQREIDSLLADGAVLIMPPHPRPAPRHRRAMLHPFAFAYTGVVNLLRMPATVAPVARDSHGLPIAVQVIAAFGNDHLTCAAARLLEDASGGWALATPDLRSHRGTEVPQCH